MNKKTAVEVYLSTVFKWGLIILVSACMCATLVFNTEKIFGLYPDVPWLATIGLAVMDIFFFSVAVLIVRTSFDKDGYLKEGRLKLGKIFSMTVLIIQWNYLLYMIPTRTFWGFLFFFLILTAFFLDIKMLLISGLACMVSLFIGWFIRGTDLLPVKDELFITDILLCVIALVLSLSGLIIFVFFVARFLVNAKKDEMELVLNSVQQLSEKLALASATLSEIALNEGKSAEDLNDTSVQLLQNSNMLSNRTGESLSNLDELNRWEITVSENIGKVEDTSKTLLEKSKDNELLLGNLQTANNEVTEAMVSTNEAANKLAAAVQEISVALKLINEISTNTHLLSINASIEAARAGQAGKAFAVVAQEVGELANKTKMSLEQIEHIINRIQNNVNEITMHIQDNSGKLTKQNEYFSDVLSGMEKMGELLNTSSEAVSLMGDAYANQEKVIQNTVQINQDIADSIHTENEQFASITNMAESNANDIKRMTEQIKSINNMVEEINNLLSV